MASEGWEMTTLGELAEDWRETWKPHEAGDAAVDHYSIPAFDDGRKPKREAPGEIKSNKRVVADDAVLLSRLNPSTPRIWQPRLDPTLVSVCSTEMLVLRPKAGVDRGFLHYVCWSPYVAQAMLERVSGTTGSHQRVSPKDALSLAVPIPPISEQRAIADVLGALDDRIDWCGRAADALLMLSRTAFRGWVATDSAETVSIYDIATVEYGAPYKSSLFNDARNGLPVIRIRDVGESDTVAYTTERHQRDVVIEPGDIVVGMDGEFRAHPWRGPTALLNQRVCTFRPKSGVARSLLLHALEEPLRFYENSITGTTVIHLGKKHIDRFQVPFDEAGNERMRQIGDAALEQLTHLASEERTLRCLRDTLLPRLVSGELRVGDGHTAKDGVA